MPLEPWRACGYGGNDLSINLAEEPLDLLTVNRHMAFSKARGYDQVSGPFFWVGRQ